MHHRDHYSTRVTLIKISSLQIDTELFSLTCKRDINCICLGLVCALCIFCVRLTLWWRQLNIIEKHGVKLAYTRMRRVICYLFPPPGIAKYKISQLKVFEDYFKQILFNKSVIFRGDTLSHILLSLIVKARYFKSGRDCYFTIHMVLNNTSTHLINIKLCRYLIYLLFTLDFFCPECIHYGFFANLVLKLLVLYLDTFFIIAHKCCSMLSTLNE